jgi:putative pyruvate formate lyase activating enzyme
MWYPSYLDLASSGELSRRGQLLEERLRACDICPWDCGVNRLAGETKVCVAAHLPIVSAWAPHFGEEPALSGSHLPAGEARGSGNIFFGHCNLRCVYCQNWQISQDFRTARGEGEVSLARLGRIMTELQAAGCHNIGLVSPAHFVPQIVKSLALATEEGLRLPLVYNTNAYDSVEVLRLLDGVVDIYLPDLKYSDDATAREYSKIPAYVGHSRRAVREMFRQVGDQLVLDERGLVRRGLIIRLLVLPNDLAGLRETLEWIAANLSTRVTLSVMSQYFPDHQVGDEAFPLLARRIRPREYERVLEWMAELGFENGWIQPLEDDASNYYRPDFRDRMLPFRDAQDFRSSGRCQANSATFNSSTLPR